MLGRAVVVVGPLLGGPRRGESSNLRYDTTRSGVGRACMYAITQCLALNGTLRCACPQRSSVACAP